MRSLTSNDALVKLPLVLRWFIVFYFAFFCLAAGVGVFFSGNSFTVYLSFLVYMLAAVLPFIVPGFRPSFFHPVIFYIIWVVIKGLPLGIFSLAAFGLSSHVALNNIGRAELSYVVSKLFLLNSLALLCLYLGYSLFPDLVVKIKSVPRASNVVSASIIWLMLSAMGLAVVIYYAGGISETLMQRGLPEAERVSSRIGGHWNWLAGISMTIPVVWASLDKKFYKQNIFWLIFVISAFIKFLATGSRGGLIIPALMVGMVWMLHYKKIPYRVIVVAFVLALFVLGGLGQFRLATQQASDFSEVKINASVFELFTASLDEIHNRNVENSGAIAIMGKVPEENDYLFGESYLSIPFVFIPSALIGDKPDSIGKLVAIKIYGRQDTAIPPGPVAEAYWNFSYIGVILVFFVYGAFLRGCVSFYKSNQGHPLAIILYVFVLVGLSPHTETIYDFFHQVLPALFIFLTMTFRFRSGASLR